MQQAETGGQVVGDHARRHAAITVHHQVDAFGFEYQVADRQHQAIDVDHDARALAPAPQRFNRSGVVDSSGPHAHDGCVCAAQRLDARLKFSRVVGGLAGLCLRSVPGRAGEGEDQYQADQGIEPGAALARGSASSRPTKHLFLRR